MVNSPAVLQATAQVNAARSNSLEVKKRLVETAKMLGQIAMDELGITAGLDCFTKGDIGACAETAVTVLSSTVGGMVAKIIGKYAWRWGKAAKLAKSLYKLGADLVAGVQGMFKAKRETERAGSQLATAVKAASDSCPLSFSPETLVLMADGTKKPISAVLVGDKVLATDTKTGKNNSRAVEAVFINYDDDLLDVVIETGSGEAAITTTDDHPFWDELERSWVKASSLDVRTRLHAANGTSVAVAATTRPPVRIGMMWDLTVGRDHNFYVVADGSSVLVHNCNAKTGPKPFGTGAHNLKIAEVAQSVGDGKVVAGGQTGTAERVVRTPAGLKGSRRPDITVEREDGSEYGINVGKQSRTGAPIKREAEAIYDLEGVGTEMHFVPYN